VEPMTTAAADFSRSVAEHIATFTIGLDGAARAAAAQANATLQLLQDPSLKRAADADPALKQRPPAIEANAKATPKDREAKQSLPGGGVARRRWAVGSFSPPPAPGRVPSPPRGPDRPPVGPAQPAVAPATPKAKKPARRGRRKTKPK